MIDIENQVYNDLSVVLKTAHPTINTGSTETNMPVSYPFVSIVEIENIVDTNTSDCCEIENFANIGIEIIVYTQGATCKSDAKSIRKTVDDYMNSNGFVRRSCYPSQNDNETEYRYILRYDAKISKDKEVYRR